MLLQIYQSRTLKVSPEGDIEEDNRMLFMSSISTVLTTPDLSKHFASFFNKFRRVCCVEWPFLNPQRFGDKILLEQSSIC